MAAVASHCHRADGIHPGSPGFGAVNSEVPLGPGRHRRGRSDFSCQRGVGGKEEEEEER